MDVKIKENNIKFKLRATAVFIYKDKILVDEYNNGTFVLPGGYINLNESSDDGVLREIEEEVGFSFKIDRLMGIIENFFTNIKNEKTHEVNFYYKVEIDDKNNIDKINLNRVENDHGYIINHHFKWININELENIHLIPEKINKELLNNKDIFHYIIKDNK